LKDAWEGGAGAPAVTKTGIMVDWARNHDPVFGAPNYEMQNGWLHVTPTLTTADLTWPDCVEAQRPGAITRKVMARELDAMDTWWTQKVKDMTGKKLFEAREVATLPPKNRAERRYEQFTDTTLWRYSGDTGVRAGKMKAVDPAYLSTQVHGNVYAAVCGAAGQAGQPAQVSWRAADDRIRGNTGMIIGPSGQPGQKNRKSLGIYVTIRAKSAHPVPRPPQWYVKIFDDALPTLVRLWRTAPPERDRPWPAPAPKIRPVNPLIVHTMASKKSQRRMWDVFICATKETKTRRVSGKDKAAGAKAGQWTHACGSRRSEFETVTTMKIECREEAKEHRLYHAPSPWFALMLGQWLTPLTKHLYRSFWAVKGFSVTRRAEKILVLVLKFGNEAIVGDVSGWDASWRTWLQRFVACARVYLCEHRVSETNPFAKVLPYGEADIFTPAQVKRMEAQSNRTVCKDRSKEAPLGAWCDRTMPIKDPGQDKYATAREVKQTMVDTHDSGRSDNWEENVLAETAMVHTGWQQLAGFSPWEPNAPAGGAVEGDDNIVVSRHCSHELAERLRKWYLMGGFRGTQIHCRVTADGPGPRAVADFCSTIVGGCVGCPFVAGVQPRGALRLLQLVRKSKCYISLLAAKLASALACNPRGGPMVAYAQYVAHRLPHDKVHITQEDVDTLDREDLKLADILAAWELLDGFTHDAADWTCEAVVWWQVKPAAELCRMSMSLAHGGTKAARKASKEFKQLIRDAHVASKIGSNR
jgi:hypothetical protein